MREISEADQQEAKFQADMDIALENDRVQRAHEARVRSERSAGRAEARANPGTRASPVALAPGGSSDWVPSLAGSSGAKPPPIKAPPTHQSPQWTADGPPPAIGKAASSRLTDMGRLQSPTSQHRPAVHRSVLLRVRLEQVAHWLQPPCSGECSQRSRWPRLRRHRQRRAGSLEKVSATC